MTGFKFILVIVAVLGFNVAYAQLGPDGYADIKKDIPDGLHKEYYKDGTLQSEKEYKNGYINGFTKVYLEGRLVFYANYSNGVLDGEVKRYYPETGKIFSSSIYTNGVKQGQEKFYDKEGKLITLLNYQNNALQGEAIFIDDEGNKTTSYFVSDIKNGIERVDKIDGTKLERNYIDNMIVEEKYFDQQNKLILAMPYKDNQKSGIAKYYTNGIVIKEECFVNDLRQTSWRRGQKCPVN